MLDLFDLLYLCVQHQASDLHLTVNEPPILRIDGKLVRTELQFLTDMDLQKIIYDNLTDPQQVEFDNNNELDFAISLPGSERFRVNVHRQRNFIEAAFRRIPTRIPILEQLRVPAIAADLARKQNGLFLITGATGTGKTTTMAALVDMINTDSEKLIITIEDPIEFLHRNKKGIVKQREVNADTTSFAAALRHALRQDPDVIVVGEMRDLETIQTAITAAETGHLVMATLHTQDAMQTISRIIDVFPPHQQHQVRQQVADCLNGVISQTLLPDMNGTGMVLATEVLVGTDGIRNLIREQLFQQIPSLMQTGSKYGMHMMDKSLVDLYEKKLITYEQMNAKLKEPDIAASRIMEQAATIAEEQQKKAQGKMW